MSKLRQLLTAILILFLLATLRLIHYVNTTNGWAAALPEHTAWATKNDATNGEPSNRAVAGYCNHPDNIVLGAQGLPPTNYKLVSVTLLIRHGNRLPMPSTQPLGPLNLPIVSCLLNTSASPMPKLLQAFIDKTSESQRGTSRYPFPLRPLAKYCKPADLTQIGVEQHIKTGQVLRQGYQEQLQLSQDNVKAVSSLRSRTFHSVIAFVFGLLTGQVDFDTVKLEVMQSTVFCRATKSMDCTCPKAAKLLAVGEKALRQLKSLDPHFAAFNSSVYKSIGELYHVHSFYPWKTAHDMMASRLCRGLKLPCEYKACLTESQADRNWQSINFYHQSMSENKDMVSSAKLTMYHMLHDIVARLSAHAAQTTSTIQDKLLVYSGHDNTLTPLLLALELPIKQWPSFASNLIFELYKPKASSPLSHYLFKLVYNGVDITKHLKFCVSRTAFSPLTGCALDDLVNYYNSILPDLGASSFAEACKT